MKDKLIKFVKTHKKEIALVATGAAIGAGVVIAVTSVHEANSLKKAVSFIGEFAGQCMQAGYNAALETAKDIGIDEASKYAVEPIVNIATGKV